MTVRPGTGSGWPPTAPSEPEKLAFEGLSGDMQSLFREFKVSCKTWAKVTESGFTEMSEWADRWPDKAACMTQAPATYGFSHDDGGWSQVLTDLNTARLGGAFEEAQSRAKHRRDVRRAVASAPGGEHRAIVEAVERENLISLAAALDNGRRPPIEDQCDDNALGKQFRAIQAGRVGDMDTKDLVPLIRDDQLGVVREEVRESTLSGTKESYQDKLADPATMDAVRRIYGCSSGPIFSCRWLVIPTASSSK